MSKKQAIILFLSAILLGFLMIQPFNYICRLTDKCYPIILSYYFPKITGKERYEVFFMVKNRSKELQFSTASKSNIVSSGDDFSVVYNVKNISDHDIKFRPMPYIAPNEAAEYIKYYECLCSREHKIKAGKSLDLVVRMNLSRTIEKNKLFKQSRIIVAGYEIE